jgi:hypothetical protein
MTLDGHPPQEDGFRLADAAANPRDFGESPALANGAVPRNVAELPVRKSSVSRPYRFVVKWARTFHVYLTLFGLMLLLFFAITGFMLNHDEWFGFEEHEVIEPTSSVPTGWVAKGKEPDKLAIVERLRKDHGARGEAKVDPIDAEDNEIRVNFLAPGRKTEAVIQREDGQMTVTHNVRGVVGVLTDLHRGKSSGPVWSVIIDSVAVLMLIISCTGLILWYSLRGRAHYGLVVIVLGLVVSVSVYYWFVPQ